MMPSAPAPLRHGWRFDALTWPLVLAGLPLDDEAGAALPALVAGPAHDRDPSRDDAAHRVLAEQGIVEDGQLDPRLVAAVTVAATATVRVGVLRRDRDGVTVTTIGTRDGLAAAVQARTARTGSTSVDVAVLPQERVIDHALAAGGCTPPSDGASTGHRRPAEDRRGLWPLTVLAEPTSLPASLVAATGGTGASADHTAFEVGGPLPSASLLVAGAPGHRWSLRSDGEQLAAAPLAEEGVRRWLLLRLTDQLRGVAWAG